MHPNRPIWSRLDAPCLAALGLVAFGFFWWLDPALQYLCRMPLFYPDAAFLREFSGRSGGLVAYAANYLAQWQPVAWQGAHIATLLLMMVYALARLSCGWANAPRLFPAFLVSALVLLTAPYDYAWLETALGLVLWLGALVGFAAVPFRGGAIRWLGSCLLVAGVSWLVGPIPGGVLAAGFFLSEGVGGKRWGLGAACGLSGGLIAGILFRFDSGLTMGARVFSHQNWAVWLGILLLLSWAAGWLWKSALELWRNRRLTPVPAKPKSAPPAKSRPAPMPIQWPAWFERAGEYAMILVAFLVAVMTVNQLQRSLLEMERCANRQDWAGVLTWAKQAGPLTKPLHLQLHRALCHQGLLLDQLFAWPQTSTFELLPGPEAGLEVLPVLSATLLEMGQPNLAEHWAHEALKAGGERPDLLLLLAKINAVKGKLPAAKVFLNRLRQCPAGHDQAAAAGREISEPSTEILRLRALKVNTDYPAIRIPASVLLQQAWHANAANRMAFEYLMAHCLLSVKPELVVKHLGGFKGFQVKTLPRHIEEAVLAYQRETFVKTQKTPELDMAGLTIRPETRQRFERFIQLLAQHKGDVVAARPAMAREFGDTYWFYSIYETTAGGPAGSRLEKSP